jgi:hypothetical protein
MLLSIFSPERASVRNALPREPMVCSEETSGGHAAAIERGSDFLALNRWQRKRQQDIFDHGGHSVSV